MALKIGTNGDANTPINLAAGDNYLLPANVVSQTLGFVAVDSSSGHTFIIEGTLIGPRGLRMGDYFDDFGNALTIGATGVVAATEFYAVISNGGQAKVLNQGLVTGDVGLYFGSNLGTGSVFINAGRIITENEGIYHDLSEKLTFTNSGTVTSFDSNSFYSTSATAVDVVINKGTMTGNVVLGGGGDTYEGNGGRVVGTVSGNDGSDTLRGAAFADNFNGGANNDFLTGRGGRDDLTGGLDADQFIYTAITDSGIGAARDIIRDFNVGNDVFNLSAIDANTSIAGNQAFGLLAKGTAASAVGAAKIGWYWVDNANDALDRTILGINNDADAAIEMTIELVGLKSLAGTPGVDFIF